MFKTSDLEKIFNHLKTNDVQEFELIPGASDFAGPYGMVPFSIKFCTNDFDLSLMSERDTGTNPIQNQVVLIKRIKL